MNLFNTKDLMTESGTNYKVRNFTELQISFRAPIEAICSILIFTIRCRNNKFYYKGDICDTLSSLKLPSPSSPYITIGISSPMKGDMLKRLYDNTPYSQVIDQCIDGIVNSSAAVNNIPATFVKFRLNYDNSLYSEGDNEIPTRYRIGVSVILANNEIYYSEFWEDLGWVIADPTSLKQNLVKIFPNCFFAPIAEMNAILYDSSQGKFVCNGIQYSLRCITPVIKILDTATGTVFQIKDTDLEPNSVLVPYKHLNISELYQNKSIVEKLNIIHDSNGLDSYPLLRSVRASDTLIAKLLTFIYTDEYYSDIERMLLPREFSLDTWKFPDSRRPTEIYTNIYGTNIVLEFDSIMNIPSDRLSKLGLSVPQIIEETRKSYSWFCSINWKMHWNQMMQSTSRVIDSIEIPFNFNKYRISLHLTQIETMFYFIASVQRYLLLVYLKIMSKLEKHENKSVISLFLGFNRMVMQAVEYFEDNQSEEDKKFFRNRSVKVSGNNILISGLMGNARVVNTNDIYAEWISLSEAVLKGNKLFYTELSVTLAEGIEKEFSNIVDFILSDLIRLSCLISSNFEKTQFPTIIEKIDFRKIYEVSKDTDNINHKRLCIELCKYYYAFYGNTLLIEDYTEDDYE